MRKQRLISDYSHCETHFSGGGPVPCAWPECPNGIADDRIEWLPIPGLDDRPKLPGSPDFGPDIDVRCRLDSYDGRERYFWKDQGLPWSLLSTQIRNHELGRAHKPLYTSQRVYHYTTLDSLFKIVESQDFWLSDYAYLNDSTEVRHGQDVAQRVFGEISPTFNPDERSIFDPLFDLPPDRQPRICVGCFSFDRDSLSQWRGYTAQRELPVAIGVIPIDFFLRAGVPFETSFFPVIYQDEQKKEMLKCLFLDWIELYRRDSKEASKNNWKDAYADGPLEYSFELFSMFKDNAFKDEHELRFVYRESFALLKFRDNFKARKRFHVVGPILRPYTTFKDLVELRAQGPREPGARIELAEVVIGPHPHALLAKAGIREFLNSKGYPSTEVTVSKVPYR